MGLQVEDLGMYGMGSTGWDTEFMEKSVVEGCEEGLQRLKLCWCGKNGCLLILLTGHTREKKGGLVWQEQAFLCKNVQRSPDG